MLAPRTPGLRRSARASGPPASDPVSKSEMSAPPSESSSIPFVASAKTRALRTIDRYARVVSGVVQCPSIESDDAGSADHLGGRPAAAPRYINQNQPGLTRPGLIVPVPPVAVHIGALIGLHYQGTLSRRRVRTRLAELGLS